MIIDRKGKLFGKISIIDLAVILIVIAVIGGVAYRFGGSASIMAKSTTEFEYVVEVENVRGYTVDALQKMGRVGDAKNKVDIGEIIDVQVEEALFQSVTADGRVTESVLPERSNCIVTLRSTGSESDNSYFTADNTELSVGKDFTINSKYVTTIGKIREIKVID